MYKHRDVRGLIPHGFPIVVAALAALLLLLPRAGVAQERDVVYNQVTVSSQEAGIDLEFADGSALSVTFRDGQVRIDGSTVGAYTPGGTLESSWRRLLGDAVAGDNGEVVRLLADWSPPEGLAESSAEAAAALHAALQQVAAPGTPEPVRTLGLEGDEDLLRSLLLEPAYLRSLTALALEGSFRPDRFVIDEDVRIEAGESLVGSMLALDSRVQVDGTLDGDLVLLGGLLRLGEAGRITGDLRWAEGEIPDDRSGVAGSASAIEPVLGLSTSELQDRIRSEVRAATADRERTTRRTSRTFGFGSGVLGGLAGLVQAAVTFGIFLAVGLAILHFFPRHIDIVSRTVLHAPGRSFLVGIAGGILSVPIWVTGMIVLAISVIGIPVLLLWIPAFPILVAAAMILGYIAVSRNVGHWVSHRDLQGLEGMDTSRPAVQIGVGLLVLIGAFAVASVLQIGGMIFSPFAILLNILGVVLTVAAGSIGLGAVLLSRAGRDPSFAGDARWTTDPDFDPWAPSPDPFRPEPEPAAPRDRDPFTPGGQDAPPADEPGPNPDEEPK